MFTETDIQQIEKRGSDISTVKKQIEFFRQGFPFLDIAKSATEQDGITVLADKKIKELSQQYDDASAKLDIVKFVPASGAASRMFKDLFAFIDEYTDDEEGYKEFTAGKNFKSVYFFFKHISQFAFFKTLKSTYEANGKSLEEDLLKRKYKDILKTLLDEKGMNYGNLPKGLLEFHQYGEKTRTAIEEHLAEGALYSKGSNNTVKLHFTVSPEHREKFEEKISEVKPIFEKEFNVVFDISFSIQKASTDTIAVDVENEPFREEDGTLLFRPAGHGALIENLNDIAADLVFIKNIDNVVPDRLKGTTVEYKKAIAGLLIEVQRKVFSYLNELEKPNPSALLIKEIKSFLENNLQVKNLPAFDNQTTEITFLISQLNRPIRVCGMVKNEGEPGGGPFFVNSKDDTQSLQIAESSQIDRSDPDKNKILQSSTHFNPVDLVVGVKNYKGESFDLTKYVDPSTGFISNKSKSGKELKALELPGLWNGAMADWNTIFVEVPIITFNPVKTVNDLVRDTHQPA